MKTRLDDCLDRLGRLRTESLRLNARIDAVSNASLKAAFKKGQAEKSAKNKRQLDARIRQEQSANSYREADKTRAPYLTDLYSELYGRKDAKAPVFLVTCEYEDEREDVIGPFKSQAEAKAFQDRLHRHEKLAWSEVVQASTVPNNVRAPW